MGRNLDGTKYMLATRMLRAGIRHEMIRNKTGLARATILSLAREMGLCGSMEEDVVPTIPRWIRELGVAEGYSIPTYDKSRGASRCPGCGGMVFMPCVLCATRKES